MIKGDARPPVYLRRILTAEDLAWLLDRAKARWKNTPIVWVDLYVLTASSGDLGAADESLLTRTLEAIRRHAPSVPDEVDRAKREFDRQEQELEEERQSRRAGAKRFASPMWLTKS